uniref:SAM domain-containing protein n=1 Tax=Esox lucius TaxID=8010 RepID=A0A6Q2X7R5_ESOLU
MMSDASEMLAAALEQMDGIIAGSKAMDYSNGLFDCQSPTSPFLGSLRALHLLEDLRAALEMMDQDEREGLRCQVPNTTADGLVEWLNGHSSDTVYQERLSRVESDKECLLLQVSVLSDQVEVQGEKIRDLDMCLEEHKEKLNATEEKLQEELLSKSSLETQKLELMTEVSSLRRKLANVERDFLADRFFSPQGLYQEVNDLRFRVTDMENERVQCEKKLKSTKVSHESVCNTKTLDQSIHILLLSSSLVDLLSMFGVNVSWWEEGGAVKLLVLSMQGVNQSTIPQPQDRRIDELQEALTKYKKVHDLMIGETQVLEQYNSLLATDTKEDPIRPVTSPFEATSNESFGSKKARSSFGRGFFKLRGGKTTSSVPNLGEQRSLKAVCMHAETERKGTDHLDLAGAPPLKTQAGENVQTLHSSPEAKKKSRGFKKFFGRLKRSQSTSLDMDQTETEFQRGGVRATAGPRLGWSRDMQQKNVDAPFAQWSREEVCVWLQELGLGLHVAQAQQWIRSGETLLQASQHDLDKELGIKHPLHRKKLQLALQALGLDEGDGKGKLDHNWVTRWLDDIGLPQYKSQFEEGKVDGRMLHYMTVDDLLSLKVGSVLHHLSIKRAIQVLRLNFYEPNCLRRRPSDENNITPAEISQWTNHRVMEWLRSADLAEYAPNLRGSGVHGGLMVLEPRFNVETLALLLNIPPNKTLLRRHLATHFHLLVGSEAQRSKQQCLENPDYSLLTATAKVKPRRLSFGGFGTMRKKRQEESEEYVCPMDVEMPQSTCFQSGLRLYEDDLDQLEQMEDSEGTVRQIGVFSEEINNLTSMLKEDELFSKDSCSPDASAPDDDSKVSRSPQSPC